MPPMSNQSQRKGSLPTIKTEASVGSQKREEERVAYGNQCIVCLGQLKRRWRRGDSDKQAINHLNPQKRRMT